MSKVWSILQRWDVLAGLMIAIVVLGVYHRALWVGFYGDDWIFYHLAGSLSLPEYVTKYFDPRAQTAWYRPVQGVLFRVEYVLWGGNTVAYHWRNILLHLANCLWLLAIIQRVTRQRTLALISALLFAVLPVSAQAVFWPGVVDPLEGFFYFAAIFFWIAYLQSARRRDYILAFVVFWLALFSKEIGVTVPIVLFLIDRCVIAQSVNVKTLLQRYAAFVGTWLVYLPIEYTAISRSVFINREGYSPTFHILLNLFDYLAALVFPWLYVPIVNHLGLFIVGVVLIILMVWRKKYFLLPLVAGAALIILPVTPFPFVAQRFLYVASVVPAILYGWVLTRLTARARWLGIVLLSMLVLLGGWRIANEANTFGEWARVARVPFRNVRQAHPALPNDTLLYFINPPIPGSNLAGMFFWHYGKTVTVKTDEAVPARLRDHAITFVYVFDAQGNQKELRVEKNLDARITVPLPVTFGKSIVLEGFELVSDRIQRGDPLVLLLYWRGAHRITDDYTVIVQVVDSVGKVAASYEKAPRRGQLSTSAWRPGELIVDAIVLPIDETVVAGTYRLTLALCDASIGQCVAIRDAHGRMIDEQLTLGEVYLE